MVLAAATVISVFFGVANGFVDAANSIAALIATRAGRPAVAVTLATLCHLVGPFLIGTAVASTVATLVRLPAGQLVPVLAAAVTGAASWTLFMSWRGLPSSSSHALVGGLVGASVARGGWHAVRWSGVDGVRPVGVVGVLATLALAPLVAFGVAWLVSRAARRSLRRGRRTIERPIKRGEWVMAAAVALSHGANDAQKTMGMITLLLVADGRLDHFVVPLWVKAVAAAALALGTSLGGWRVVRTVGSGIYRISPLDGLISQTSSAGVIFAAGALGGPVGTSHVVASSIVGVGTARRRLHVHWHVVSSIALGWLVTLPASALLAALLLPLWRWLA